MISGIILLDRFRSRLYLPAGIDVIYLAGSLPHSSHALNLLNVKHLDYVLQLCNRQARNLQ